MANASDDLHGTYVSDEDVDGEVGDDEIVDHAANLARELYKRAVLPILAPPALSVSAVGACGRCRAAYALFAVRGLRSLLQVIVSVVEDPSLSC